MLNELSEVDEQFLTLRYKKLMNYTYEKNIPLFIRKLKDLKNKRDVDLNEIFDFIIAVDRDNLILCIHLSNRNINEIDLNGEIDNMPLKSGDFNYIQTRLRINSKIIVIYIEYLINPVFWIKINSENSILFKNINLYRKNSISLQHYFKHTSTTLKRYKKMLPITVALFNIKMSCCK